jgi:hypothetical protein
VPVIVFISKNRMLKLFPFNVRHIVAVSKQVDCKRLPVSSRSLAVLDLELSCCNFSDLLLDSS